MPKIILKIIPTLLFWGIFIFIVFNIPYPESLVQANFSQIAPFFIFLFLALTLTFNLFLKNIFLSLLIAFCLILLLILKALDSLSLITIILVLAATGLFFSYFRKGKRDNLTKQSRMPKLTQLQRKKR